MTHPDIDTLERELASLTADLERATHRQLAILRELEPTGFWAEQGAHSFPHWLSWKIGLAPGAARESRATSSSPTGTARGPTSRPA